MRLIQTHHTHHHHSSSVVQSAIKTNLFPHIRFARQRWTRASASIAAHSHLSHLSLNWEQSHQIKRAACAACAVHTSIIPNHHRSDDATFEYVPQSLQICCRRLPSFAHRASGQRAFSCNNRNFMRFSLFSYKTRATRAESLQHKGKFSPAAQLVFIIGPLRGLACVR